MRLVSASLQSHMSQTVELFQIHEVDAALHTSLLNLCTLRIKGLLRLYSYFNRTHSITMPLHAQYVECANHLNDISAMHIWDAS